VQEVQLKRTGLESLETTPTVRDDLLYHRPIRDDIGTLDKLCITFSFLMQSASVTIAVLPTKYSNKTRL